MPLNPFVQIVSVLVLTCGSAIAQGAVWHVDDDAAGGDGTTWAQAFNDLQGALDVALSGDEIWVGAGTYYPSARTDPVDSRSATFELLVDVGIYGGFAGNETARDQRDWTVHESILSGDLAMNDGPNFANNDENAYQVVFAGAGIVQSTVVDGLVITAGKSFGSGSENRGGGIHATGAPTIRNCTLEKNFALSGGGMWTDSVPQISRCEFRDNRASFSGGGLYAKGSNLTVRHCSFLRNSAGGGGAATFSDSSTSVEHCTFFGNRADGGVVGGGAVTVVGGSVELTNCILAGNTTALLGSAIDVVGTVTITNCTLAGNRVLFGHGGAIWVIDRSVLLSLRNTIVWDNSTTQGSGESAQIFLESGSPVITPVALNHSCVQNITGVFGGVGNIGDDPRLADVDGPDNEFGTADDNVRIRVGSPCVDAGDNSAVPVGIVVDLDGVPRFVDDPLMPDTGAGAAPIVDMGAYEFPERAGDCTGNGLVNLLDFATFAKCFGLGASGGACGVSDFACSDVDESGTVNLVDFATIALNFQG